MRAFAEKPKAIQQTMSIKTAMPGPSHFRPSGEGIANLKQTIGPLAARRLTEPAAGNAEEASAMTKTPRIGHDFGRISVHDDTKPAWWSSPMNTVMGSAGSEMTVASLGAAPDEEMTVPDAGVPAAPPAPAPATPAPTAPAPAPASPAPATATFCKATPTSASIKNVTKYTDGKLYGHNFDFVVDLTYAKLGGTATKSEDCTFEWWEKTSRPPAWQTVIKKDTWNDMYALYPTSSTFSGWTSRTKPCPGTETATVHDIPGASVDLPARTLAFNLVVKGGGTTKSATGTQILEPDGKGGIKTQSFTTP
jgi:hypothetical protein